MIDQSFLEALNKSSTPTPSYVIDLDRLEENLKILREIKNHTNCAVLIALKAFGARATFPLIKQYLDGASASSLYEAKLGLELGAEVHVCGPAYPRNQWEELLKIATSISFNSLAQWKRFKTEMNTSNSKAHFGIRINPECSNSPSALYDPCGPYSRLGSRAATLSLDDWEGLDGIHFHTLCQQNTDALEKTIFAVEANFAPFLERAKWVNFGGGHHITREDYDIEKLVYLITHFQDKYKLRVIIEPGEAVVLNAGYFFTEVLDIMENEKHIAILDCSATTHMPDVLEMPYRPDIIGAGKAGEKAYSYLLGGMSCLAGDTIGDYSFDHPLKIGDRLVFTDMAQYTFVKNTTFNGVPLPALITYSENSGIKIEKEFGYADFVSRL